jgi:hypothetical protein
MKIELNLNKRQLDALLSAIESTMIADLPYPRPERGPKLLEWVLKEESDDPSLWAYDTAKLAPAYARLIRHWTPGPAEWSSQTGDSSQVAWGRRKNEREQIERLLKAATAAADAEGP